MYEKLEAMQAGYTHCIFLTNMSALHHDLVIDNLIGKAPEETVDVSVVA
jgi:hypothetical protein